MIQKVQSPELFTILCFFFPSRKTWLCARRLMPIRLDLFNCPNALSFHSVTDLGDPGQTCFLQTDLFPHALLMRGNMTSRFLLLAIGAENILK